MGWCFWWGGTVIFPVQEYLFFFLPPSPLLLTVNVNLSPSPTSEHHTHAACPCPQFLPVKPAHSNAWGRSRWMGYRGDNITIIAQYCNILPLNPSLPPLCPHPPSAIPPPPPHSCSCLSSWTLKLIPCDSFHNAHVSRDILATVCSFLGATLPVACRQMQTKKPARRQYVKVACNFLFLCLLRAAIRLRRAAVQWVWGN